VDDLRAVEVSDATVTSPPRSRLAASDRRLLAIPNAVTLRLFPDPPMAGNGVEGVVPASCWTSPSIGCASGCPTWRSWR